MKERELIIEMAHEARASLASIVALSETILSGQMGEINDRVRDAVRIIYDSGRHLLDMTGNVLDIDRFDSGAMELDITEFAPTDVISEIVNTLRPAAESKGLHIDWRGGESDSTIKTDRLRLKQILLNLMSNAIKFTDAGHVTISYSERNGELCFCVADTGIGIGAEERSRIFDEFTRFAEGRGGYGLGLAIVRRLVQLLGGRIEVESEPGVGSKFTLILPKE